MLSKASRLTTASADPQLRDARTPEGATLVQWAVYTGHAELAPLLLGERAPDFFEACALGRAERAAELLDADSTMVNQHSRDGFTGLGLACFFRQAGAAELLADRGADVSLASADALRVAPLHSATASGEAALVELLLARGADPNVRDAGGITPLHTAAATGNRAIFARLVAAGADRGAVTNDGKTIIDIARQFGKALEE